MVEDSKQKYSVNGRSSHPDVFYKKVLLKVLRFPQKNICVGVSSKQGYCSLAVNFIKKRLQHRLLTPVNFAIFLRFFKNISGRMLLEKHWISLKMLMTLILVSKKDLNFSFYFFIFSFFFEVCLRQIREYFYGTFYQSFSCTLVFSALSWGFISSWLHEL